MKAINQRLFRFLFVRFFCFFFVGGGVGHESLWDSETECVVYSSLNKWFSKRALLVFSAFWVWISHVCPKVRLLSDCCHSDKTALTGAAPRWSSSQNNEELCPHRWSIFYKTAANIKRCEPAQGDTTLRCDFNQAAHGFIQDSMREVQMSALLRSRPWLSHKAVCSIDCG